MNNTVALILCIVVLLDFGAMVLMVWLNDKAQKARRESDIENKTK